MILRFFTFILISISLLGCQKNNEETSTCNCDGQAEYVCWKLNGTNQQIGSIEKFVDDVSAEGLRHYAFRDLSNPYFYLEFEWPTQITVGQTYNLDLNSSNDAYDFDYGYGEDTVFYKGTFLLEENTSTYIKGKFTASDAKVNGVPNPNLVITNGCFKLNK